MSGQDTTGSAVSEVDAPHVVQIGSTPAFVGDGRSDLVCRCGASVLIRGYLPQNFLAIRIMCGRCASVSVTPGLPSTEILSRHAVAASRIAQPAVLPSRVPRGAVLACEQEMTRDYKLTQPHSPPTEPMVLSPATLEIIGAAYDRLTGGLLAEHSAEAKHATTVDDTAYPLAWALLRLRDKVAQPEWSWLHENEDALAAMHIAALHQWLACWRDHKRLDWIATALASPGRFLRTMSVFETARLLFEGGNRVGFIPATLAAPDFGLYFSAADEPLALAIRSPLALQWPARERWNPAVVSTAIADAVAASHGVVNRSHPGILVLPTSIVLPHFDQAVVDGIHAVLGALGRKHRGLAGIAAITPKVWQAQRLDQVNFAYGFYPIVNPHFAGENPIRMGPEQYAAQSPRQASQKI